MGNETNVEDPRVKESKHGDDDDLPTAEDQLEAIGMGRFNYIILATLILLNVAYGMEILVTNISFRAMPRTAWGMTDQDRAHLVSLSYVGFITGALIAGFSSDIYGRRPLIILHGALFLPFALASALAQDLITVYLSRIVVGMAVGIMLPVSVSLMAELAIPSQRGWMILVVPGLGFVGGQILVLFVGMIAMHSNVDCQDDCGWWRWVFAAGIVPDALALLLFFLYVPESPRYLLYEGRVEEAEAVLKKIAETNDAVDKLKQGGKVRPLHLEGRHVSPWDLFVPPLRKDILTITVVWTMFGFGLYTLNYVFPIYLENTYHLNSFQQFGILFFYVLAEGSSIIIVVFIVDLPNFGRLFFILTLSVLAIPFLIGSYFALGQDLALFCAFLFLSKACCGAAYQTMYIYAAELLPTSHRSMGIGLANGTSKSAAVVGPPLATALWHAGGAAAPQLLMAGVIAGGALILVAHSSETLGKALADVSEPPPAAGDAAGKGGGAAAADSPPNERTPLL